MKFRAPIEINGQITSLIPTGTAPLVVASTTYVQNLNADLLDGYHASFTPNVSTIPIAGGSGTIALGFIDEVLSLANLADVSFKTGTGDTVVMGVSPIIISPVIGDFTSSSHTHLDAAGGGTLTSASISNFTASVQANRITDLTGPATNLAMNSFRITGLGTPTLSDDAATKDYVDSIAQGLDVKHAVRVVATSNINTASPTLGSGPVDGVSMVDGDRILLAGQSTPSQNGIWIWAIDTSLSRASDSDSSAEVKAGLYVWVEEGTTYADTGWILTTNNPITLNTTSLAFTQFTGAGLITAGAGLTKSGNTLNAISGNAGIVVNADDISVSAALLAANTLINTGTGGLAAVTAANTVAIRTITGTTNRITVTNGNGASGNPTVDISTAYVGQNTITTLGTITTGTWSGTTIAVNKGGTGGTTAALAKTNLGFTTKYAASFGDGLTTSYNIDHNLGTLDVTIAVFANSNGEEIDCDITRSTTNRVILGFTSAPTTNQYRVVVTG